MRLSTILVTVVVSKVVRATSPYQVLLPNRLLAFVVSTELSPLAFFDGQSMDIRISCDHSIACEVAIVIILYHCILRRPFYELNGACCGLCNHFLFLHDFFSDELSLDDCLWNESFK